jgi:hypothetical protein
VRAPASATARFPAPDLNQVQASKSHPFPERKVKHAMAFLREVFADGQARQASEIMAEAEARDFRPTTVQVAKRRLHISSQRAGQQWIWVPPKPRQARKKPPAAGA